MLTPFLASAVRRSRQTIIVRLTSRLCITTDEREAILNREWLLELALLHIGVRFVFEDLQNLKLGLKSGFKTGFDSIPDNKILIKDGL